MGADNWATCPRCFAKALAAAKAQIDKAVESYGKVPIAEFDALRKAVARPERAGFMTFREDYWFLNNNKGSVEIHYSGSCTKCGLEKEFDTTLDLVAA